MARPESFQNTAFRDTSLQYPDSLGSEEAADHHYMIFDAYASGFFQGREAAANPNLSVALYIPPGALKTQYTTKYETLEGGQFVIEGLGKQQNTSRNTAFTADGAAITTTLFDAAKKLGEEDENRTVGSGISYLIAQKALEGSSTAQQAAVGSGVAVNPYLTVFFKGPGDFRTHSFSFDFIARNQKESIQINKIVNELSKRMLPAKFKTSGHSYFLKYPDQFRINFYINGDITNRNKMFFIKRSVLTTMSVDYAGQGIPVFFKDVGQPFNIKMDLTFQELTLVTREDIGRAPNEHRFKLPPKVSKPTNAS